ncbi:MAG: dimethyl sulfoxide reductase anchor subunit [Gammaproteobacteria bacterium]|nr:dimethyl sulfoxide reductase anchor subunit [Gammaproteobacteria bacterium]MCP4879090.1 dimethyl sulfoxide reductase anchor subunit [Gammaproteobacteria bacterium]
MHPAFSVLIFTITSGAGYGLLGWLSANELFALWPLSIMAKITIGITAMVLISVGLSASTWHLANRKNAWRSFSGFRTSWLSREAVFAIVLYPVATMYAAGLYFGWPYIGLWSGLCLLLCLVIVFVTSMIYASLKTIPQWHTPLVPTLYLLFAIMSGGLAWAIMLTWNGLDIANFNHSLALIVAVTASVKLGYFVWFRLPATSSIQSATGFTQHRVSLLDAGHSAPSFLNKEFMFDVEQVKLVRLRWVMFIATFVIPLSVLYWIPTSMTLLGAWLVMMAGLLIERWLFFAEARHVVRLFHGQQKV